jgi:ABC-2 type transport system permease protein
MQFPRLVIPLSVVLTAGFNMCLNLVAVFVLMVILGLEPIWTWVYLPLILAALLYLTTAFSMILAATYVRFRDVAQIWTVVSTALFYGAPALYPIEIIDPGTLRDLVNWNPISPILEQARVWIIDPSAPGAVEAVGGDRLELLIPIGISIALGAFAIWIFNREAPRIAEEL